MPRWPNGRMTREQALQRRKEQYLWRKLNGFCVSCRSYLPGEPDSVYCKRCKKNQAKWQKTNKAKVCEKSARHRAKLKGKS